MRYEKMAESIEVIVHFATNGIRPLRFLWKGNSHRVRSVRGRWTTLEGKRKCRHYAVTTNSVGNCEISFDTETMAWRIESVAIPD